MMQGRIASTFARVQPIVGHIQIAGVPGRCEPDDRQEINYPHIFELIAKSGYEGWIGCEYRPRAGTSEGLAWMARWRQPL
jgi:hydroxypyruvate isomerase